MENLGTRRKSPLWEGIKATFKPALKGAGFGAILGVAVGVATATLFALISAVTGNGLEGMFDKVGVDGAEKSGLFSEMNGFTSYKVQTFFNGVIIAGMTAVNNAIGAFSQTYQQTRETNRLLDIMEGKGQGVVVGKSPTMQLSQETPEMSAGLKAILDQGPAESHKDMAARMANAPSNGKLH